MNLDGVLTIHDYFDGPRLAMEPHELLETVVDESSFLAFAQALLADRRTHGLAISARRQEVPWA